MKSFTKKILEENLIDKKHYQMSNIILEKVNDTYHNRYGYDICTRSYDGNPNYNKLSSVCVLTQTILNIYASEILYSALYIPINLDIINFGEMLNMKDANYLICDNSLEDVLRESQTIPEYTISDEFHIYGSNTITLYGNTYKRIELNNWYKINFNITALHFKNMFIECLIPIYDNEYKDIQMKDIIYQIENRVNLSEKNIYRGKYDIINDKIMNL